jgi:solute:Na+ symporter, SSS family
MRTVDWLVVAVSCSLVFVVGMWFSRRSSKKGAEGYFTGHRDVPWWAIGLANTATYSSGTGGFVMLVLVFGIAGNWLWWASWIIWMPLVAIVWARMWRRMQIVTTAELISLRYGGTAAQVARKVYAFVCCFGFAVLIISYITGFFAKTIAPLCPSLTPMYILLIFGGITVLYTMFGGLLGVVYADVAQFAIMITGVSVLLFMAIPQHGGWSAILQRVSEVRPDGLTQLPPTKSIETLTILVLVLQGWFFAGSPTAGEGMTAQRFMSARNEGHAIGGQLFNCFLALSFRTLPLIGLGIIAMSLFWTEELTKSTGRMPAGVTMLKDSAYAWGELIKSCKLPTGFVGLLVAAEAAAFMSALSSLINWGSSFVVNDLLPKPRTHAELRGFPVILTDEPSHRVPANQSCLSTPPEPIEDSHSAEMRRYTEIWISRITTLLLFILAAVVTVLFVDNMVSWFMFINSAMVLFLLPLSWFRFFWWRFNVWGELAAVVLGLPLSIVVWFVLDFQNKPMWQGLGLLLAMGFVILTIVTLITPPEKPETLKRFYERCRPPGFWGPVRKTAVIVDNGEPSQGRMMFDCLLGILACLGLVLGTNAVFVGDWTRFFISAGTCAVFGGWLLARMLKGPARSASGIITNASKGTQE